MKRIQITIITLLMILTMILPSAASESNHLIQGLTYIKDIKTGSKTAELIRIAGDKREIIFSLPENGCWSFSTDGVYFTVSDQNRSDLIIRKMSSLKIVYQEPFQSEWQTCSVGWQPDNSTLSITRSDDQTKFLEYKLVDNTLTSVNYKPIFPQYPELPDWLKGSVDGYILPSPDSSIFLYEKCQGLQTTRSGNSCAIGTDFVIYDSQQKVIKTILQDVNSLIIEQSIAPPFDVANGAAWSATGRYLAYPSLLQSPFNINIYDLVTDQYIAVNYNAAEIDWQKDLQWSPVGDKLAYWFIGSHNETDPETYRSLVFFDAHSQQFVVAQQGFNRGINTSELGVWSPDGGAFAFIDEDKILYSVDSFDGIVTQLDSDVLSILNWT